MNLFENADEYSNFLESMRNGDNDAHINAVTEAYDVCLEGAMGSIVKALVKGGAKASKGLVGALKGLGKGLSKGGKKATAAVEKLKGKIDPQKIEAFKAKVKEFAEKEMSDPENQKMLKEMGDMLRQEVRDTAMQKAQQFKQKREEKRTQSAT